MFFLMMHYSIRQNQVRIQIGIIGLVIDKFTSNLFIDFGNFLDIDDWLERRTMSIGTHICTYCTVQPSPYMPGYLLKGALCVKIDVVKNTVMRGPKGAQKRSAKR